MGSRIREKPERLYEVFLEIAKPQGGDEAAFVIQQYPPDYEDKEALAMIPKFAYPCPNDAQQVDHFTFVLTDLDSMFRFGYCRHATGHQTCLCIVSWLPWCEIFYKMLDLLAEITNRSENNEVSNFLQATYNHDIPPSKVPVTIVAGQDMFSFTAPDHNVLPSIPGSRNLTEYYNAVDPSNMMLIFASMLHERRIYMTSKKLSRLTACIHAAEALLYPMHWQHLYIPVLPAHLIDYISAPMPYLIGVHSNLVEKLQLNRVDVGDAVVVDLDANTVTTEYDDLGDLPEDVSTYLKRNLKTDVIKNSMPKAGDAISMAFLQALIRLIGGYRDALKFRNGEPITFNPEAFVQSRSSQSTQAFLEGMLTLQIFQQFIYGRLEILNAGEGFRDIFEQQATIYADKLNSQSKYKEWLKSVKKSSKKGWNGFKVKAAPMMSTAVHSMKEQGKRTMAEIKTKFSGLTDQEEKKGSNFQVSGGVVHSKPPKGSRPATTHEATLRANRPPRPPPPKAGSMRADTLGRPKSIARPLGAEDTHDDSQLRLSYQTVDVSLMGDEDVQALMLRSASAEMLTNRDDVDSSVTASDSSSGSSGEIDSANIPFDALHSSDEGVNRSVEDNLVKSQQELKSSGTGDKLILSRPRGPVAPPRGKRSNKSSPNPSPQDSPVTAARNTTAPHPPKPLPRQSSLKQVNRQTAPPTVTIPDAPLIKFDSSESDPTDSENFDPLSSVNSPQETSESLIDIDTSAQEGGESGDDKASSNGLQRNTGSRVSLTRSKAFRRGSMETPMRTGVREDTPEPDLIRGDSPPDIFDPLASLPGLTVSSSPQVSTASTQGGSGHQARADPLASHSPRRDSSDLLMHEWSLASLAKGPTVALPVGQPLSFRYPTNPFVNQAQKGGVHQPLPSFSAAPGRGQMPGQRHSQPGMFLGQQMPGVHHVQAPGSQSLRQSFPTSSTVSNPPGKLPASSFARFSQAQSSVTQRSASAINFEPPVQSSSSPFVSGSFKHVQPPSSQAPSAPSSQNQQADLFSDLLDIDFTGGAKSTTPQQPQQQASPQKTTQQTRPSQPKWETFD